MQGYFMQSIKQADSLPLNLARKWRSKNFNEIVGQELSVKILRNTLYLNQFFPVYLFSGQRGCGKTTMARLFAAALNCEQLSNFQHEPKQFDVPCRSCVSCLAMEQAKHPDFIEMDAASHTGVDHVRQIIEASSLLPLVGKNKIYLIDEAHMLSKAAFNAFLKILEEPPKSVYFILATTDPNKIIETVRSRCFQLFFGPIERTVLVHHLKRVCHKEQIAFDEEGLSLIVQESEGSVRDALNLVEQVRFSHTIVSKKSVQEILGCLDDEVLIELFNHLVQGVTPAKFLQFLQTIQLHKFSPLVLWSRIHELIRLALYAHYEISLHDIRFETIRHMIRTISVQRLLFIADYLYEQEQLFLKTTYKHLFLELLLIRLVTQQSNYQGVDTINSLPEKKIKQIEDQPKNNVHPDIKSSDNVNLINRYWPLFIERLQQLNDQLVLSIIKQATFEGYNKESKTVTISFSKSSAFLKDLLEETMASWLPLLQEIFQDSVQLLIQLREGAGEMNSEKKTTINQQSAPKQVQKDVSASVNTFVPRVQQQRFYTGMSKKTTLPIIKGKPIDVSDAATWKMANALLKAFPGTVTEIQEEDDL